MSKLRTGGQELLAGGGEWERKKSSESGMDKSLIQPYSQAILLCGEGLQSGLGLGQRHPGPRYKCLDVKFWPLDIWIALATLSRVLFNHPVPVKRKKEKKHTRTTPDTPPLVDFSPPPPHTHPLSEPKGDWSHPFLKIVTRSLKNSPS